MSTAVPEIVQLPAQEQQQIAAIERQITGMVVRDSESYSLAVDLGKQIKDRRRAVEEFFVPLKRAADAAKRVLLDAEKKALGPLQAAESHLSQQVTNYRLEQERIDRQRREQAEEEERARIRQAREREAEEARARGREKLAAAIEKAPIDTPKVNVPSSLPAVGRIARRKVWKFRVVDPAAVPPEFLIPDEKKIGERVREQQEKCAIAGVEVWAEDKTDF
jgi:phage-related minor tail protein